MVDALEQHGGGPAVVVENTGYECNQSVLCRADGSASFKQGIYTQSHASNEKVLVHNPTYCHSDVGHFKWGLYKTVKQHIF